MEVIVKKLIMDIKTVRRALEMLSDTLASLKKEDARLTIDLYNKLETWSTSVKYSVDIGVIMADTTILLNNLESELHDCSEYRANQISRSLDHNALERELSK